MLKNRIIMGSMHSGLEDVPNAAERLSAYFVERVRGGVGMIITGGITPHPSGGKGAKLSEPSEVPMHRAVTDAVHAADPQVKICMQILHSGSIANVEEPVGPSPVQSRIARHAPIELDADVVFELPSQPRTATQAFDLRSPYADQRLRTLRLVAGTKVTVTLEPFEVLVFDTGAGK